MSDSRFDHLPSYSVGFGDQDPPVASARIVGPRPDDSPEGLVSKVREFFFPPPVVTMQVEVLGTLNDRLYFEIPKGKMIHVTSLPFSMIKQYEERPLDDDKQRWAKYDPL